MLVIVCLLIVQAYCDLALPKYTSDIVDVGIMQNGIGDAVPDKIRGKSLEDLKMFIPEEDIKKIEESYKENNDSVFELQVDRSDTKAIDDLNDIFKIPMMILATSTIENTSSDNADAMKQIDIDALKQGYNAGAITKEQLTEIRSEAEKSIDSIGDMMVLPAAISFVRAEYEALGLDINDIQMDYMFSVGLIMILLTIASVVVAILVCLLASYTASKISKDIRRRVYFRILDFSSAEMDKFTGASLITRSTNDIQNIQMALTMIMRIVLLAPIMAIGGVIMVVNTKVGMGWIVVSAVAVLIIVIVFLLRATMPKFKIMQTLVDRVNLVSREILTGLPVIRAFCREDYEKVRFDKANVDFMKTQLFTSRALGMMFPFLMLLMNIISVVIVWFGAKKIDLGTLQVGDMMAFITYTIMIVMSFVMMSMIFIMLPRANVAAERVKEVINTEILINDKPAEQLVTKSDWKGRIDFRNVCFRYPDANENVLQNIDFSALPGQTTAIIGSTGSGKSTLINLIPRLFDVTEGSITLDDVDIRDISQHELRSQLGVVPQKGILFSGDINSNLKYGRDDASDEIVKKAAEIAQADSFIEEKEDQYDSPISQGGTNVSGGQKQRLSIARAIVKDPRVFIFDDSFSALDYKTDSTLRKALSKNLKDRTVIIVAQRISTILRADKILVLDDGEIVGEGTHQELLENCEVYREIAYSQLSEKELAS